MKQTLRTYIYTCLIFLIPFILISFILSIISYFMQMNTLFIQIIIQIFSYFILIIAALYLTSHLPHQRMKHCIIFAVFYLIDIRIVHLNHIHIYILFLNHLFLYSLVFLKNSKVV